MQNASRQVTYSNYLDFELEIGPGRGREYPIEVLSSPAGEAHATLRFPYDELVLESRLKDLQIALLRSGGERRRIPSAEELAVQEFGQSLFDALLSGEVRSRYDVSLREAAQQGKGLRLKLRIQSPKLAALPWEFLYDSRQAEYVGLSRNTPIVRYLELPAPPRPLAVTPPLRILGMIAAPHNLPPLDMAREKGRIERATQDLRSGHLVELTWIEGQTWRDLQQAMWGGPWHIFHFIGHGGFDPGSDEGFVVLTGEDGQSVRLSATQLGRLLADHSSLRLVLLNSCEGARGGERDIFSSAAAILVRRGVSAVVAMQYEITDRAAIEFAQAFYGALTYGKPVDEASVEARKAISVAVSNTVEWGTPVLHMRSPDGTLFDIQRKALEPRPPSISPPSTPEHAKPSVVHRWLRSLPLPARAGLLALLLMLAGTFAVWLIGSIMPAKPTQTPAPTPLPPTFTVFVEPTATPPPPTATSAPSATATPPAGQIAFVSDRDGNREIYMMNADGSGQTNLTNNLAAEWGPAWSPDGERIAFVSDRDGNEEIYVMNADGSGQTNLTRTSAKDHLPVWSPNGSQIAFISDRDGREEIYVMDSNGLGQTRLMNNSGYLDIILNSISWSPDSSRIVFFSDYGNGNWDIYVVSADGSGRGTRLTDSPGRDECPAWSPDSERIAYVADTKGIADIYLINADGSGLTPLTSDPATDLVPRWSPNGKQIAFISDREGYEELYVMNSDGSALRRLSYSVRDIDFAWSADGRQIAFLTDRDGNREIYAMNSDGSGQTRLTTDPATDYAPTWRPALPDLIICGIDITTSKITICNLGTKAVLVNDLGMCYRPPSYEKPGYSMCGDVCGIVYCDDLLISAMIPPNETFVIDWREGFGEDSEYMIYSKQGESDTSNNCVNVYARIIPCRSD